MAYEVTYEKDNLIITQVCSFQWLCGLENDESVTIISIK